ncbi:MAG: transposase [Chloroflexi bacterium]|nr:transposase [Chloroflexota bacterium]
MDMHSRNEYVTVLKERYRQAKIRDEKSRILDEYCANTGQRRKHAIRRLRAADGPGDKPRGRRGIVYDGAVRAALAEVWEVFDHPCGQRLEPVLKTEVAKLREMGELKVPDEVADKLVKISPATIDRKLKHQRETLHLARSRGGAGPAYLLKQKIQVRLTQWDTSKVGYLEVDTVFHCGSATMGQYINTVSATEISSGWWEGQAIMGKAQTRVFEALKGIRARTPFQWKGIDSDNGQEFINDILFRYCNGEGQLLFTRSRANHKNDNAYIEEKNWTHVRKVVGYLRHDTLDELAVLNDLYADLRLYKNLFQPVMKLVRKEKIGGRLKRKYDQPKTPYQRLIESGQLSDEEKEQLRQLHDRLNPVQLKRSIDAKLEQLYQAYQKKTRNQMANPQKKQTPRSVTSYMIQQTPLR